MMSCDIQSIKKRVDFIKLSKEGLSSPQEGLVLQVLSNKEDTKHQLIRFGVTATKKIGNAVIRNKCKRKLRVLAKDILSKYAKKNNIEDIVWRMYFSLGRASQGNEDYNKALEYYQDVRPLIERANDTKSLTYLLNNIAGCYLGLSDYENAIAYYTQNLEVSKKAENQYLLAASYSGLAHVYSDKDEYLASNKFYLKTLNREWQIRLF